eukprot:TRINITY_DN1321_c1_g2_i1.p1 TRINITY_DN1321_c1_g2~~TRINITY_DN1321_c1_g2_i1.p1  ORF type:complete len:789 (+),score=228.90 TRINITY_DN1321_c1_g2_i1:55-2421(+)
MSEDADSFRSSRRMTRRLSARQEWAFLRRASGVYRERARAYSISSQGSPGVTTPPRRRSGGSPAAMPQPVDPPLPPKGSPGLAPSLFAPSGLATGPPQCSSVSPGSSESAATSAAASPTLAITLRPGTLFGDTLRRRRSSATTGDLRRRRRNTSPGGSLSTSGGPLPLLQAPFVPWRDLASAPFFEDVCTDLIPLLHSQVSMIVQLHVMVEPFSPASPTRDPTGRDFTQAAQGSHSQMSHLMLSPEPPPDTKGARMLASARRRLDSLLVAALQLTRSSHNTAEDKRRHAAAVEAAQAQGWREESKTFEPPLGQDGAARLSDAFAELKKQPQPPPPAADNPEAPLADPRERFAMEPVSRLEKLQADLWDVMRPPVPTRWSSHHRQQQIFAWIEIVVLVLWGLFFITTSLPRFHRPGHGTRLFLDAAEGVFSGFYTVEWLLRAWAAPRKAEHMTSMLTMMQLIAVLPFYVEWAARWSGAEPPFSGFVAVFGGFRAVRVFSVTRHMSRDLRRLMSVIEASRDVLLLGLFSLGVCMIVMSSLMYTLELETGEGGYCIVEINSRKRWIRRVYPDLIVENDSLGDAGARRNTVWELSPFQSYLNFFWWSITTLTTVGYGDTTPVTVYGKVTAGVCTITGALVLALPASVICSNFTLGNDTELASLSELHREQVRRYVEKLQADTSFEFREVLYWHFCMLLELEDDVGKKEDIDLAAEIYERVIWVYNAARQAEARHRRENTAAEVSASAHAEIVAAAEAICRDRFVGGCAEVFRLHRRKLYPAFTQLQLRRAEG